MKPYYEHNGITILNGHVLRVLAGMEAESVHMVVTSPPYWGLRDYGLEPVIWRKPGADPRVGCPHDWGEMQGQITTQWADGVGNKGDTLGNAEIRKERRISKEPSQGQFCLKCNAWRGSLGLEPTIDLYVSHLVVIFREVKRVLRKDGILALNLGDSYASQPAKVSFRRDRAEVVPRSRDLAGLKPKDLCEVPSDVVRALRADGWWLRSRLPWVKRSAMPESVTDRPASALEYVFLLTKNDRYFFDMDAIKIPQVEYERARRLREKSQGLNTVFNIAADGKTGQAPQSKGGSIRNAKARQELAESGSRNFRNTDLFFQSIEPPHGMIFAGDEPVGLDVNPQAFSEAHFATFSEKLIEPLILAGTSEKGCCPECGAPWVRVVEKVGLSSREWQAIRGPGPKGNDPKMGPQGKSMSGGRPPDPESKTIGWEQNCGCKEAAPIPCTVCDIFGGSGTSALVAYKHRRKAILIELSEEYAEMAKNRLDKATRQGRLF